MGNLLVLSRVIFPPMEVLIACRLNSDNDNGAAVKIIKIKISSIIFQTYRELKRLLTFRAIDVGHSDFTVSPHTADDWIQSFSFQATEGNSMIFTVDHKT